MENKSNLINFSCYAVTMFTVLAALILIAKPAKPAKPVISERESVRVELQQAIDTAGLAGLIEVE